MSERVGRGVLDCPLCKLVIIGGYSDLIRHLKVDHPLESVGVVDEDGRTVFERVKKAQKEAPAADVQNALVDSDE